MTTDAWAGASHLEAREDEAKDGRFISVDPVADFMDPQQLNGHVYANHAPVSRRDPSGAFVTASDHWSYAPGKTQWRSPSRPTVSDTIDTYVDGWGRPMAGGPASSVPRYVRPVGQPRDFVASLAANVTGTVDLVTNAVQGRAPWSDDYNGRLTDKLNALLGTDSSSFVYESVSVVSVLVSIASAGSAAGKVPDRTSKSANGPSKCDGLTHSSSGIASYSTQRAITTGHRGAVLAADRHLS